MFEDDFPRLACTAGGTPTIKENPPTLYHHLQRDEEGFYATIAGIVARYRESLPDERRVLLDRFRLEDMAIKVVGVGSVGTVCSVALLMASADDPLFLQIKEARASVLEAHAGKSVYENHGQRVVVGHRLVQSASDIFLGWTRGEGGRHFYVRQLRDVKIKFRVEAFKASKMLQFADWCGAALARAHARSGEPAVISGYLGKSDVFESSHRGLRRRLRGPDGARPRVPRERGPRGEAGSAGGGRLISGAAAASPPFYRGLCTQPAGPAVHFPRRVHAFNPRQSAAEAATHRPSLLVHLPSSMHCWLVRHSASVAAKHSPLP